jgi:hypothetical protein
MQTLFEQRQKILFLILMLLLLLSNIIFYRTQPFSQYKEILMG